MNNKKYFRFTGACVLAFAAVTAMASELQDYVQQCQNELDFKTYEIPQLDCNNGERFSFFPFQRINDFVLYHRVNDKVDLAVACRWGDDRDETLHKPFLNTAFISLEMVVHNRETGGTCFFGAKDTITDEEGNLTISPVPNPIVSPTNFSSAYPNADDYWMQPTELNNKQLPANDNFGPEPRFPNHLDFVRCVDCHSQGPYIASKDIAPYLAQYGLINDGHDILADFNAGKHYYVVGSKRYDEPPTGSHAFEEWHKIIYDNITPSCAGGCHQVAENSDIGSLFPDPDIDFTNRNVRILPSITFDIDQLRYQEDGMPPSRGGDDSHYRWMNLETPWDGIENETFAVAKDENNGQATSRILSSCTSPGNTEAHAVGVHGDNAFSSLEIGWLPNRLNRFNLKEGLLCLNAEQGPGQTCKNYQTSYLCDGEWTDQSLGYWFDTDSETGSGDHEQRSRISELCPNPAAIKARFFTAGIPVEINGPNDRLALFNKNRLVCNSKDQVDGQCSNYVVRYRDCTTTNDEYPASITSAWSTKQLTASGGGNNAPVKGQPGNNAWNTQEWIIEPEANSDYVRLRNTGTNTYLNVSGQAENAVVETYEIRDWDSQRWIIEPVSGSIDYRLKNVWSGKYLTLRDTSNYSGVYSQPLNTSWPSQRWLFSSF